MKLSEAAQEARREYYREYRRKNREKVKTNQANYWEKRGQSEQKAQVN